MEKRIIKLPALKEIIEDARIVWVNKQGTQVAAQWPDKSIGLLTLKDHDWAFADGNSTYQAGYAYASGYRD